MSDIMERSQPIHYSRPAVIHPDTKISKPAESPLPSSAHLIAGASGGFATAILTSPLDVLRTRLQSDFYRFPSRPSHGAPPSIARLAGNPFRHLRETVQIFNSIHTTEGWRGLFRGLGPSLAGVVPATAIKFYVYGNCKRLGADILGGEDAVLVHAQAAIIAGIATATATNPIWLVKTRLQLDKSQSKLGGMATRRYKNSVDCVRQVLLQEGIRGLYRGLSASYLGSVETALHLILYERLKIVYRRSLSSFGMQDSATWGETRHWISTSGAAGSAKLAAVLIAYPHEVVRTRLREAPMENGRLKYTGLWQCFQTIGRQEGLVGLYGGLTPHIMRSVPSAIITLGVYEFVLRLIGP